MSAGPFWSIGIVAPWEAEFADAVFAGFEEIAATEFFDSADEHENVRINAVREIAGRYRYRNFIFLGYGLTGQGDPGNKKATRHGYYSVSRTNK